MSWIFIALTIPFLFGVANVIDNYVSTTITKGTSTVVFYSAIFNILFLPLLCVYGLPGVPHAAADWGVIAIIAVLEVLWLFPYFKAYEYEDTSVVASLFSLGKICVPIFAFFIVGEVLQPVQYIGFIIIIFASAVLTAEDVRSLKFNNSFMLMLLSSAIFALQAVLYKEIFFTVDWVTGFFWTRVCSFFVVLFLLIHANTRSEVLAHLKNFKRLVVPFTLVELATFLGMAAFTYVLTSQSATVVESIAALQPICALLLAVIFSKRFPEFFSEKVEKKDVLQKVGFFVLMIIGVSLVI